MGQAWELKVRAGLINNSGLVWNPAIRQWRMGSQFPESARKAIAHYASWTATAARVGINTAEAYRETERIDELAKFYSAFLRVHFTTLGDLRKGSAAGAQKLLGPELGPDGARTLAWYWDQPGGVILRECYQCNAEFLFPAARLVRIVAAAKSVDRTDAMKQFVAEYVPLLVKEHVLRPHFAERMRREMNTASSGYRPIMIADELFAIATAAEVLGARAADPKLAAIDASDAAALKELVQVGVERFQFSRTLSKDASGRTLASYFNGDYDSHEDMEYAGYAGEAFPTPAQKARAHGVSWDISHFSLVPMFLRSLFENRRAIGGDFPTGRDMEYITNQFVLRVFEGDDKKPLFRNFFDGSDGWYRVNYSGRSRYAIAPSAFCDMADPSHGCTAIAGIYSWGLLAALNPDINRIYGALIDLARSRDSSIACFEPKCFREKHYRYADTSFSFLDADERIQYPPALVVILSEIVLSASTARSKN